MKKLFLPLCVALGIISCSSPQRTYDIVPYPNSLEARSGDFDMRTAVVSVDDALGEQARKAAGDFGELLTGWQGAGKAESENPVAFAYDPSLAAEQYTLEIKKDRIDISASSLNGTLYAIQTLKQLMPVDIYGGKPRSQAQIQEGAWTVPCVKISDSPRFGYRGMHMDVARHFFDVATVKRYLDAMSLHKLNTLHWHLTDDQGWRIEIKRYPDLTLKGGFRNGTVVGKNWDEYDGIRYGGYYTQDEIREVVAYAASLGIDIIPEVDMPGHMSGAIAVYPELSCFDRQGWGHTFSDPLCPGKDATLEFCKDVYREIFELFPFEYVHLGADEVEKDNWEKCPNCQWRIKKEGLKDEKELQSWFVHEMEAFFNENGKKMMGWDEITEGGLSPTAAVMWWRTWARNAALTALEQGNKVYLTPNSHYYFDYQQHATTLRDLYEFSPVPKGAGEEQYPLILGVQANTWAEYIPSRQRQDYMIFPRALAFSDVAWRGETPRDWDEFYPRLLAHFPRLDKLGVNYRPLDLPGVYGVNAFVDKTEVTWNYPLSAVELRYTTDGTIPDRNSELYGEPIAIDETTDFIIRLFRPDGSAADIIRTTYRKEEYRHPYLFNLGINSGLKCAWHEGIFNKCEQIEDVPVKQEYVVDGIKVPEGVGGRRGLVYTGFFRVPADGIYTFSLGSDDGSMLYIHDELVIDNDGPHGPVTVAGQIALAGGCHPLRLYYFDMNNGGFVSLRLYDQAGNEIILNEETLLHTL